MGNTAHEPIVTENPTGEIETMIREMPREHFADLFVFNPIAVEVKTGHDHQDYLHAHIVFDRDFDGGPDNLDPRMDRGPPGKAVAPHQSAGIPWHTHPVFRGQVRVENPSEDAEVDRSWNPGKCPGLPGSQHRENDDDSFPRAGQGRSDPRPRQG